MVKRGSHTRKTQGKQSLRCNITDRCRVSRWLDGTQHWEYGSGFRSHVRTAPTVARREGHESTVLAGKASHGLKETLQGNHEGMFLWMGQRPCLHLRRDTIPRFGEAVPCQAQRSMVRETRFRNRRDTNLDFSHSTGRLRRTPDDDHGSAIG
jgi:hypothetical protein